MDGRRPLLHGLACACAALGACGARGGEPPRWVPLARSVDGAHAALEAAPGWGEDAGLALALEPLPRGAMAGLTRRVAAERWESVGPDTWRLAEPLLRAAGPQIGCGIRIATDGGELAGVPPVASGDPAEGLEPGQFRRGEEGVTLRRAEPPPDVDYTLRMRLDRRRGDRRRTELGRWSGDGFHVWSGVPRTAACDVPAGALLDLATTAAPFRPEDAGATAVLRVSVDGRVLLERRLELGREPAPLEHRTVALPEGVSGPATFRFELEGPPALAAVLAPVLRPAEVGAYASRPWEREHPDILLFVADTFRADNMAVYGGRLELTPNLDALAAESLVFRRAWSPGTWTFPAQAALLTGRPPTSITVDELDAAVDASVIALAELLRGAGYRTGAVTDGLYVSRTRGLQQGFELFDERWRRTLEETGGAVQAFLDRDDGRPVFLFVQTYRVHDPYYVSSKTLAEHGERLGIEVDWETAHANPEPGTDGDFEQALLRRRDRLRALYRGGVIDLDLWLGELVASLRARGFLPGGLLAFTSDHGEAFAEHGKMWHGRRPSDPPGGALWEEVIRIPLLLHGAGIAPGEVSRACTLTDLSRTLADLLDVPAPAEWEGASLLSLAEERTLLVFEEGIALSGKLAVIRGPHKAFVPLGEGDLESGAAFLAYDLERDPGETESRCSEAWPAELVRSIAPRARARIAAQALLLAREEPPDPTAVTPGEAALLERLGYAGLER